MIFENFPIPNEMPATCRCLTKVAFMKWKFFSSFDFAPLFGRVELPDGCFSISAYFIHTGLLSLGHTADIIKKQENIDFCCVFQDQDNFMITSFLYTEHYVFCYISNALGLIYSPANAFPSGLAAHALEQ